MKDSQYSSGRSSRGPTSHISGRSWEQLAAALLAQAPLAPPELALRGWLLPDGRIVELPPSKDERFGPNWVEHGDAALVIGECSESLEDAGIARFRVGDEELVTPGGQSIFVEIGRPLSAAQERTLWAMIRTGDIHGRDRELAIDVVGPWRHTVFSDHAVDRVSVRRLMGTARRYARDLVTMPLEVGRVLG